MIFDAVAADFVTNVFLAVFADTVDDNYVCSVSDFGEANNISCVVDNPVLEFPVYSNFVINTTATIVIADFDFNIAVIATSDFAVCVALGVATDVIDFYSVNC